MPYYTDEEIPTSGGMEQFGLQYDPSMSVLFGESLMEGIRQLTPNLAKSYSELQYAGGTVYENEEQWQSSEFFREGLKFEEQMTEGQARLLAERYDRSAQYSNLVSRANSLGDYGAIFGGMFIGSIPDPINFIPWLGFAKKGKQAKSLIDATTRGRAALRGSAEASLGAAAFHPLFALEKGAYQEEYDISMALVDVGLAAGIGAGLGSIFGRIHPDDPPPVAGMSDEAIRTQARQDLGDDLSIIRQEVRSQVWRGLDHVPPQSRVMAVSLAHSQMASGQTVDAARVLNQVEIDSTTLDGAPSGMIRGSFQDSVLNNEDGTLQTWYHGTVQRDGDQFETIVAGPDSNGMIPFTSNPKFAAEFAEKGRYFGIANWSQKTSGEYNFKRGGYKALHERYPDVFDKETGDVLNLQRLLDDDVKKSIKNNELTDKNNKPIKTENIKAETLAKKLKEGFEEISTQGAIYPRFLNVKNIYPEILDSREIRQKGAEWFKKQGYDAVRSSESGFDDYSDGTVLFTVDPNQSKSIYDPEFTQFNEATSADPLPPVDETPVRNEFELEEENIDLEIAARESELTEQDAKDLAEMDQMVADVDRQAQAYRAAADCVMRT
jgi:hypothetical protein